jgi:hypothetical protein
MIALGRDYTETRTDTTQQSGQTPDKEVDIRNITVYISDFNMLGGSVHTLKENAEALVVATKEIGLEVNADKTNYMVMSRKRNAGRGHSVKIDNNSI